MTAANPRTGRLVSALALCAALAAPLSTLSCACARSGGGLGADASAAADAPSPPAPLDVDLGAGDPEVGASDELPPCTLPERAAGRWYDEAIGYEIFVRSFQDSDGDGVGDLAGATERLGYLKDLGVDLLWLMPITESPSYHGYDVTDYRAVDAEYGTDADLETFLAEAHSRGIRVLVDLVVNHSSKQHPWFVDAMSGADATYRDYYVWSDAWLDWDRPWGPGPTWHFTESGFYYALFWDGMPDLNFGAAAVRDEVTSIAMHWLDRGVDGFRLDAARYLFESGPDAGQADTPETHAYWAQLAAAVSGHGEGDALLLGEVWTESDTIATYFGAEEAPELGMAFDFDAAFGAVDGVIQGSEATARIPLCARIDAWPTHGAAGTFLTNHDIVRLGSRLGVIGEPGLRLAAALLLTLPGTPWIYYGQELGMLNGATPGDEAKRLPMQWDDSDHAGFTTGEPWAPPRSTALADSVAGQLAEPQSLLAWYRDLIALRRSRPALSRGSMARLQGAGTAGKPLAVRRRAGDDDLLLVFQFAAEPSTLTLDPEGLGEATAWVDLVTDATWSRADAQASLELAEVPARSVLVLSPVHGETP